MERAVDHMIVKIAITAAVLGAAIVGLVRASTSEDVPYRLVDELTAAELQRWMDHEIKVNGQVAHGSIVDVSLDQQKTSFVLYRGARRLRVIATNPPDWGVRPEMEMVAQGHLVRGEDGDPVLIATALNARCPNRYDGGERTSCPRSSGPPYR